MIPKYPFQVRVWFHTQGRGGGQTSHVSNHETLALAMARYHEVLRGKDTVRAEVWVMLEQSRAGRDGA